VYISGDTIMLVDKKAAEEIIAIAIIAIVADRQGIQEAS
jgi:hypothetical protein